MTDRPSGTITFLFTDIEGSTKLWENHPQAMKAALARHDALLKQAIESKGGYVFKTIGDAFCAAFAEPTDALEAALAAQRALTAETWPAEIGAIRIRAALHTGVAEEREGDYFGQPLNRVARLLAAGHGGQTLITLATQELVRDSLPQKVSLADLGDHRLKDLFRPERVYQVNASGLPSDFPALRTLDVRLTNLPAQATPFVGREREIAAIIALLRRPDVRLVTLTGPGGTGKTRLSLQAAADLLDDHEHGVWLVNLAPVTDPTLVAPAFAAALGVHPSGDEPLVETLKAHLAGRDTLLVIDNFEQVVEAAPLVSDLLASSSRLKALVTSREALQLSGEHRYDIPPMALPDLNRKETVAVISQYEAVSLFIQRAQAAQPGFAINEKTAPAIAEICVRLDGLPLAIELAASRVNLFSPEQLLARLADRLKTVSSGRRDLPARQRTLRGTIDWSYDLLSADEKTLFACLAVFQGGRTLETAEAVIGDAASIDVSEGMESLVNKSLLRQASGATGQPRFVMLETIHEYAREKLKTRPDAEAIRARHAAVFADLATRLQAGLDANDPLDQWASVIEDEENNLLAALEWAFSGHAVAEGARLLNGLYQYWFVQGKYELLGAWAERALSREEILPPETRLKILEAAGLAHFGIGQLPKALEINRKGAELARALGDPARLALMLGRVAGSTMGDKSLYANAQGWIAESLAICRRHHYPQQEAISLIILGEVARAQHDFERAAQANRDAIKVAEDNNIPQREAMATGNLGMILNNLNDPQAIAYSRKALHKGRDLNWDWLVEENLWAVGRCLAAKGQPRAAARLYGAAESTREAMGARIQRGDRDDYERGLASIRKSLDKAEMERLWAEGRAMTFEDAITFALEERDKDA